MNIFEANPPERNDLQVGQSFQAVIGVRSARRRSTNAGLRPAECRPGRRDLLKREFGYSVSLFDLSVRRLQYLRGKPERYIAWL